MKAVDPQLKKLFHTKIGIKDDANDEKTLLRILDERMALGGVENYLEYYHLLMSSPYEFQEFIEGIIVPETWFFREAKALEFLAFYYQNMWEEHHQRKMKILTIPCSSGEESYSILMAFHRAGIAEDATLIDAMDISKKAIAAAKRGIYGLNSFRGSDLSFRSCYFRQLGDDQYEIDPSMREGVNFQYGNIIDPHIQMKQEKYDVVFCRNLLIYFHEQAQKQTLSYFDRILHDDGILMTSSAESEIVRRHGFEQKTADNRAVYFVKAKKQQEKPLAKVVVAPEHEIHVEAQKKEEELLAQAESLANRQAYAEATDLCLSCMEKYGVNARAYFLLGVIQHALGFTAVSEDFFKKVLYLDPNNQEALVYLALLADKRKDHHQSHLYRLRAGRKTDG